MLLEWSEIGLLAVICRKGVNVTDQVFRHKDKMICPARKECKQAPDCPHAVVHQKRFDCAIECKFGGVACVRIEKNEF